MKWTKGRLIGLIALSLIALSAMAFTTIENGWLPQKKEQVDIARITNRMVVEYTYGYCTQREFDTYVVTKTEGGDEKKYIRIDMLSSLQRESDILEDRDKGIEQQILSRITLTLLEKKPAIFEGFIETQTGVVEYYIKEYSNNFATFYITKDRKDIIKYTGKKQIVWDLIAKIREISTESQAKQKYSMSSKTISAAVIQSRVSSGTMAAQSIKMLVENIQVTNKGSEFSC